MSTPQECPAAQVGAPKLTLDMPLNHKTSSLYDRDSVEIELGDIVKSDGEASDRQTIVSATSTVDYDHESYDTFQDQARSLILEIWPDIQPEDVKVERMHGGRLNRLIGITVYEPQPKRSLLYDLFSKCLCLKDRKKRRISERYILRIPRFDPSSLAYDVTTQEYADLHMPYPVPKVVSNDKSSDNALGRAYALQKRLPGEPLSVLWDTLNKEQKESATRAVARVLMATHKLTHKYAGIISKRNTIYDLRHEFSLEDMFVPSGRKSVAGGNVQDPSLAVPKTTRDFLISLCERQREVSNAGPPAVNQIWTRFISMITKLHQLNLLPDTDTFHFHHANGQPQNFLFTITTPSSVRGTGILGWDEAVFAPKFMSTSPPSFLWENEEAGAELKSHFKAAVTPDLYHDMEVPELVLARKMYHVLTRGIASGAHMDRAEKVLAEFEELHPALVVGE